MSKEFGFWSGFASNLPCDFRLRFLQPQNDRIGWHQMLSREPCGSHHLGTHKEKWDGTWGPCFSSLGAALLYLFYTLSILIRCCLRSRVWGRSICANVLWGSAVPRELKWRRAVGWDREHTSTLLNGPPWASTDAGSCGTFFRGCVKLRAIHPERGK